jgi:histidinol phosphatase-like PHP family hydrolase
LEGIVENNILRVKENHQGEMHGKRSSEEVRRDVWGIAAGQRNHRSGIPLFLGSPSAHVALAAIRQRILQPLWALSRLGKAYRETFSLGLLARFTMQKQGLLGKIDFHVHTIHSNCGKAGMAPSQVSQLYESRGYRAIGLTDHYDPDLSEEKIRQTKDELEESVRQIDIYLGAEACVYLPDWPRRQLRRYKSRYLDFCILSPSHRPSGEEVQAFSRLPLEVKAAKVFDSFVEAVRCDFADAIAHPFAYGQSQIRNREEVLSAIPDEELRWALELANRNEIAMEFSPRILGLPEDFLTRFIGLCKEADLFFSVGGDVHAPESVGNDRMMLPLLKKHGIESDRVWYPAT